MLVWTLPVWRRRVLLDMPAKGNNKGLQRPLMAIGGVGQILKPARAPSYLSIIALCNSNCIPFSHCYSSLRISMMLSTMHAFLLTDPCVVQDL